MRERALGWGSWVQNLQVFSLFPEKGQRPATDTYPSSDSFQSVGQETTSSSDTADLSDIGIVYEYRFRRLFKIINPSSTVTYLFFGSHLIASRGLLPPLWGVWWGILHLYVLGSLEDSSHNEGLNMSLCHCVYSALHVPTWNYSHLTLYM